MSDYLDNLYSELSSLVASLGFNDGANKGFWRKQPRKKWGRGKGQWLFMGAKVRLLANHKGKRVSVTGRVIGSDGTPTGARFLPDPGQEALGFDSNTIYGVDTAHIEEISAVLSEDYVEGQGVDVPDEIGGTGSTVADANIPNVEDLETAPATPDDFRLADEGVNSPEGKEQEAFKDTEEGKEVARLVDESPDVATSEEVSDLLDGGKKSPADMSLAELEAEMSTPLKGETNEEFERYNEVAGEFYNRGGYTALRREESDAAQIAAEDAIERAMRGDNPGSLDGLIMAAKEPPKKKKRASKKKDEEDTIDDGLDDFDPEADITDPDFEDSNDGPAGPEVEFDPEELKGTRASSAAVPAAAIVEGDVILHNGEPAKVMGIDVAMDKEGGETGELGFKLRTADGTDYYSDKNEFEDVTRLKMEKSAGAPGTDTPEVDVPEVDVPEVDEPGVELERIAPDTAEMVSPDDIKEGDVLYSDDGTEMYGTVVSKTKDGTGLVSVRVDAGDGSKPSRMSVLTPMLTQRAGAPEVDVPEVDVPEVDADLETARAAGFFEGSREWLRGMKAKPGGDGPIRKSFGKALVNGRTSTIAQDIDGSWHLEKHDEFNGGIKETKRFESLQEALDEGNAFLDNKDPKFDAPETDAPETDAPETDVPETDAPDSVDETGKDRTDRGQEIAFPAKKDADLFARKVSPLRDSEGRRVKAIDPETGEEKSTFAEDPDAVLNAILEEYPDAVIDDNGAIIVAREKFTDPDGSEYEMESRITRTNGANYMISYKITMPDGEVVEYFHHDYRDSFSSIHGKANGIQRMAAILRGDIPADYKPAQKKATSREWKYFATGKFADRMKFFRDKYKSNVSRGDLENSLAKAKKSGNLYDIGRAEYHLELLDNEFGGDINKLRDYFSTQDMTFVTMQETIEKYAGGRFYKVNKSKAGGEKNYGSVLRSAVPGIFGSIKNRDSEAATAVIRELLGRLPDITKHKTIIDDMMKQLENGAKTRFPDDNRNSLRGFIAGGIKALESEGFDADIIDQAPQVGWDGRILKPGMLVQYDNNNNEYSVGILDSIVPVAKNPDRPNEYNDYVLVRFRDQNGEIGEPVEVSAKNITVLDETGTSPESLKRMTIYTPRIGGEVKKNVRFGDGFMMEERAREAANNLFGRLSEVGEGINVPTADPEFYSTDNATPGRYLYDANGLPLGQIAAVRETKSESGEDGYNIAYVTPANKVEFVAVKSGEIRAPKQGLTRADGRGSNESDAGFTPDPSAFSDIGLDASTLGSDSVDSEEALIEVITNSPIVGASASSRLVGHLLAVKNARKVYQEDPSDENRKAYKAALSKYYEDLSLMGSVGSSMLNRPAVPMMVSSDDILTPDEIADINGKIRATQMEAPKRNPDSSSVDVLSYEQVKEAVSAPENTYSGHLPAGWSPQDGAAALEFEKAKHAEAAKKIISVLGGDDADNISDALADALAESIIRFQNSDGKSGNYKAPPWDVMSNEFGDVIRVNRNGEPGSGNGYIASDSDIDTAADVFRTLRERLNIGDMPLDLALTSQGGVGSALGFVYTADMWTDTAYQARAHLLIDTLPRNIQRQRDNAASGEKFKAGTSWWAVDLSSDPEGLLARYVIAHELGHVMQGQALRMFGKLLSQETWNKFYGPVAEAHKVSQYGESNYNEHFAESFVKWIMTGQAHPTFLQFLKDTGLLKSN